MATYERSEPGDLGFKIAPSGFAKQREQEIAPERMHVGALLIASGEEPPEALPGSEVEEYVCCTRSPITQQSAAG